MKYILAWVCAAITGAILHFIIFIVAYQKLTFPYLLEEQRVENAPYIFIYVLPAILLATLVTTLIFSLISRRKDIA